MKSKWFLLFGVAIGLSSCGRSTAPVTPANQAAAPEAAPPEALPLTIEDVRALRTAGRLDEYERALRALTLSNDRQTRGRAAALLALTYLEQKRTADAAPLLARAAADDASIAPWMWLRAGDADSLR